MYSTGCCNFVALESVASIIFYEKECVREEVGSIAEVSEGEREGYHFVALENVIRNPMPTIKVDVKFP